ncbi:MAG: magnesium transporter [Lachnospiraceae bacterium]|nr:magnesium transporter [Lachnospiraceae bacterium]
MEIRETTEHTNEQDIIRIIKSKQSDRWIKDALYNYHDNDIARTMEKLDAASRKRIYQILDVEKVSEIFSYIEDPADYLNEIPMEQAAYLLENMDADDAVDALNDIENEAKREKLIALMADEASEDVRLINSYDESEIGSMMTTNFVTIPFDATIKQAMQSVITQAKENDNINTIYVIDGREKYYGAIELRNLIIAREHTLLGDIISRNYPSLRAEQSIQSTIEFLKDYAEDSIPVLDEQNKIIGIITSQGLLEAVDDELVDDYAKLAGLTAKEDVGEKIFTRVRNRIPSLLLLLLLGIGISAVIGCLETVTSRIASQLSVIMCFQALILALAGNTGTQSLAVAIRALMDEDISPKERIRFVGNEMLIGGTGALLISSLAFGAVGIYLHFIKNCIWTSAFYISGCISLALLLAMLLSSLIGVITPILFHKIKLDPAIISSPLITTVNDLIAIIVYYGLAGLMLG